MRVFHAATLMWAGLASLFPAYGQVGVASVRVFADAPDARLTVDGQAVQGSAIFLWPQGSKHTLAVEPVQVGVRPGARYVFHNWADSKDRVIQGGHQIVITADPAITHFKASFGVEFAVTLSYHACAEEDPCISLAGKVYINSTLYSADAVVYLPAESTVILQAVPNPGFVFAGWNNTLKNGQDAFLTQIVLNEPYFITPRFQPARRISILSEPEGLRVLADRAPVKTPASVDWGWDTVHTLGPISPQYDENGRLWVFAGWAHGGDAVQAYHVPPGGYAGSVTAVYVPGARVSFLTEPPGLKLSVDGRENWQGYNFAWHAGEKHVVSAPLEQRDVTGRVYVFRHWSNGGAATQEIQLPEDDLTDLRVTAHYELLGRLTVRSAPAGMSVEVDGQGCLTPCVLDRPAGATVSLTTPASVGVSSLSRLLFRSWDDGDSAGSRRFTFSENAHILTVRYGLAHRITSGCEPSPGGAVRAEPPSADGFYDEGAVVTLIAAAAPGFRFRRWEGDLAGNGQTGVLRVDSPKFVRAVMEPSPYVPKTGVRNAAGDSPLGAVAPGSIVSIFGANLARATESGPLNPLSQTLGGVTVRLESRLLPLFFASPEQINLLLPRDLEPGRYTLSVRSWETPELTVEFEVTRNAPGLFTRLDGEAVVAAAIRDNGTLMTAANAVKRGEIVTLTGSGFGPYDKNPPEGFAVPRAPVYRLVDAVEIMAGDMSFTPEFAGAAEGLIGVDIVRWRIPQDAPPGLLTVRARANGVESNAVRLFIE